MVIFADMRFFEIIATVLFCLLACSCSHAGGTSWTEEELSVIGNRQSSVMRVLTISDRMDSLLLRRENCEPFTKQDIRSKQYDTLSAGMIATVTSPDQDGVGIAGPQVGISRRIVAVQRFDKEGEPFEVYPNIEIVAVRGGLEAGGEGCLSVPGRSGNVKRYQDIDIRYTSPKTLEDTVENVKGFTAVIFQHECDHLKGTLYIDYLGDEQI